MSFRSLSWRLALAVGLLGLPGVAAFTTLALPRWLPEGPLPAPLPVIMAAALLQSALLLAVCAVVGAATAPRVGLRCPLVEALLLRQPVPPLRPLGVAGLAGGLFGALWLLMLPAVAPPSLAVAQAQFSLPLAVRLLYGGLTEEVLLRWGLMSLLLWTAWRVLQRGQGRPRFGAVALAVGLSALLFGVGHLPAAVALAGGWDASLVAYIIGGNAVFGVVAGLLYWRHGLESAMLAHALAHLGAWALGP
jgi:hypothetical protein